MGDGQFSEYLRAKQAPELSRAVEPESHFFWQAYWHLRGESFGAMGRGPIPFRAISAYSDWVGLTCPVEKARLVKVIMAMDNADRELTKPKAGE